MKRLLSGAAILMLGLLGTASAKADGWADAYGKSSEYGNIARSSQTESYSGRASLNSASSDDDEDRIARRWSKRASEERLARKSRRASRTEGRKSRSARAESRSGGGNQHGMASFYWQRQRVASGGWFNPNAMTAAHKTLPFGTRVRVTNVRNGRSAVVTINDRGPYVAGRVIDLSKAAAGAVGMIASGVAPVRMEVIGR